MTAAGGKLFLAANDGVHGDELWVSDGTAAGTRMLADIIPGSQGSNPSDLTPVGNDVYFIANEPNDYVGLWKSDGTVNGTAMVTDFVPTVVTVQILPPPSPPDTTTYPDVLTNLTVVGSTPVFLGPERLDGTVLAPALDQRRHRRGDQPG